MISSLLRNFFSQQDPEEPNKDAVIMALIDLINAQGQTMKEQGQMLQKQGEMLIKMQEGKSSPTESTDYKGLADTVVNAAQLVS